jgi:5-methyltetrahydropteroyltriglutamate--homocysteine methyltransferase
MNPPFRADHVGSLRRPESLMRARERLLGPHDLDHNFGPHANAELHSLEDQAIREVVKLQEDAGLRSITDGEFRRRIWWSEFFLSLEGVQGTYRGGADFHDRAGHTVPAPRADISARIRWTKSVNVEPFRFLKSVTRHTPKVTMPAPQQLYHFATRETVSRSAYPDLAEIWDDLAEAYSAELKALAATGATYVQMDEVVTSCLCDKVQREKLRSRGDEPEAFLGHYIRTMNAIAARKPRGMTLAMHTCRGNYQGHWMAEGGYDPVAERVFNEIKVDAFSSSTTRRAPAASSRCASSRKTRCWCSAWCRPRRLSLNRKRSLNSGSRKPRATSISSGCASRRSAGSRATISATR